MDAHTHVLLILHFLFTALVAGLIGTAGMTFFMWYLTYRKVTNADMVRAIGSFFTRSIESSLMVGTLFHLISGVGWAMFYILALNFFELSRAYSVIGVSTALGFLHGFIFSFILISAVAEHHPLEEFKDAGVPVALAHVFGHVVYGMLVGIVIVYSGFSLV